MPSSTTSSRTRPSFSASKTAQSKLVFDLSNRHQLQLNTLVGRSRYSDSALELGGNEAAYASNRGFLANLTWRYTPGSSLLLTQRLYAVGSEFENVNRDEALLDKGIARDLGYRVDVTYALATIVLFEAGGQVQQLQEARSSYRERLQASTFEPQELFDTSGSRGSVYGALRWAPAGGWSLSPGARIDHWGLTAETTVSPWLQAEWRGPGSVRVKLGAGLTSSIPSFDQVAGLRGSLDLRPERAWHYVTSPSSASSRVIRAFG